MATDYPDSARQEFPQTFADADMIDMEDDDEAEFDEDDGECAFCLGREAAHRGESDDQNPYPKPDFRPGSIEWIETDHGLWLAGYGIGSHEPGGVPLYLRKDGER